MKVNVAQSCLTLRPHGLYSPWNSPGRNTGVGSFPSPGDLPNPGIEPRSPTLQADSLQAEPQGKPKNPGVGSLSLLQGIFPTQESNQGLLHCRGILYQLSHRVIFQYSDYLPPCCKLVHSLAPSLPPQSQLSQDCLRCCLPGSSPNIYTE